MEELQDALIKLDELSLILGNTLRLTRIGWDNKTVTCENILDPINQIAKKIGEAIPQSIKATRLTTLQYDKASQHLNKSISEMLFNEPYYPIRGE